jgi:hypothetical protein
VQIGMGQDQAGFGVDRLVRAFRPGCRLDPRTIPTKGRAADRTIERPRANAGLRRILSDLVADEHRQTVCLTGAEARSGGRRRQVGNAAAAAHLVEHCHQTCDDHDPPDRAAAAGVASWVQVVVRALRVDDLRPARPSLSARTGLCALSDTCRAAPRPCTALRGVA